MSDATESQWPEGDAFDWTVEHALTYALHLVRTSKVFERGLQPNKCYIIMLNDEDYNYGTREINSGMKRTELVQLLEVMKFRILMDYHYIKQAPPKSEDDESQE